MNNLSNYFNSYDLLTIKKDDNKTLDCEKLKRFLTQSKPFNTIKITDTVTEGDENVNFDLIIGNPPYQQESRGANENDTPIYHYFYDIAFSIAEKVELIMYLEILRYNS